MIINTNLGGTWAEGVWNSVHSSLPTSAPNARNPDLTYAQLQDNSYAGQPGSCASQTGYSTAADCTSPAYTLAESLPRSFFGFARLRPSPS